jgi:hypothetical protein
MKFEHKLKLYGMAYKMWKECENILHCENINYFIGG